MKSISQPAVITPSILLLALLFAGVVFIGSTGKRVPLLSNIRVDIILLVISGHTLFLITSLTRVLCPARVNGALAGQDHISVGGTKP